MSPDGNPVQSRNEIHRQATIQPLILTATPHHGHVQTKKQRAKYSMKDKALTSHNSLPIFSNYSCH